MKIKAVSVFLAIVMICSMAACGAANSEPSSFPTVEDVKTDYEPVTIVNMERTTTYEAVPERIITYSYEAAEILVALGLKNKIIGLATTHTRIKDIQDKYTDELADIPVLATGVISLESALKADPDFAFGNRYNFMSKNSGAPEDYEATGVNVYIQEGSYVEGSTVENTYNDITSLGKIFHIEESANKLIEEMKATIADVEEKVSGLEPVRTFVYDSGEGVFCSVGKDSLESAIVLAAGGRNIYDDTAGHYIDVSIESVVERNPEAIIILDYFNEGDPSSDNKAAYLTGMSELAEVSAVKNNRVLIVPLGNVSPGLENSIITETIARFLHPNAF